jgi:curved DNA-binding protein CbpA
MDLYEELAVSRTATDSEIVRAHRKAVKQHHPDKGGQRERFDRVQRAFDILRDPERRQRYDETGQFDESPANLRERKAITAVREALMSVVLGQQELAQLDVVGAAIAYVQAKIAALRNQTRTIGRNLQRLALARASIRNTSDHEDVVDGLFAAQIDDLTATWPRIEEDLLIQETALEILGRYSYEIEMDGRPAVFTRDGRTLNLTVG